MVNKNFVSYSTPNADVWLWPVIAKSESESENIWSVLLTYLSIAVLFPFFSLLFAFFCWILYRFEFLNLKKLKLLSVLSGIIWVSSGLAFGIHFLFSEIWHSIIWQPDVNNIYLYILFFAGRTTFVISSFFVASITFNRRQVNPEKVHIKVAYRQRHERMRHMRKWQKNIKLKETL